MRITAVRGGMGGCGRCASEVDILPLDHEIVIVPVLQVILDGLPRFQTEGLHGVRGALRSRNRKMKKKRKGNRCCGARLLRCKIVRFRESWQCSDGKGGDGLRGQW